MRKKKKCICRNTHIKLHKYLANFTSIRSHPVIHTQHNTFHACVDSTCQNDNRTHSDHQPAAVLCLNSINAKYVFNKTKKQYPTQKGHIFYASTLIWLQKKIIFINITHKIIVKHTILLWIYSMRTKYIKKAKTRQIFPLEHNSGWAHTIRSHATPFFIQFSQLSFINCRGCGGEGGG